MTAEAGTSANHAQIAVHPCQKVPVYEAVRRRPGGAPSVTVVHLVRVAARQRRTNDAWRNEAEHESMLKWNLTALTYMHVDDWKKLFKEVGYSGDYYWSDLQGKTVVNTLGVEYGRVSQLMETGANDVLVVTPENEPNKADILIPYIDDVIVDVDLQNNVIRVDWDLDY